MPNKAKLFERFTTKTLLPKKVMHKVYLHMALMMGLYQGKRFFDQDTISMILQRSLI